MKTLLQLFTRKSRWSQRLMTWGLAIVVVIGITGLLQTAGTFVEPGHQGTFIHQAFALKDPVTGLEIPDPNAARTASGGLFGGIGQSVGNVVASLATLFIKLLAGILWFVLYWMGDLMDNTFILEGTIGEKLHSVWVIVRNFVNIFFALALVVVALMSVLGVGDESGNYGLKKFIPKMALALIAVNFTFFACRIVLDINNVLTTAIFDIPRRVTTLSDIGPTGNAGVKTFKKFKCLDDADINTATTRMTQMEEAYPGVINQLGGICFAIEYPARLAPGTVHTNGQTIIPMGSAQYSQRNFVWAMATQFQGLHNLNKVSQLIDPTFTGLTVNALFSIIFAVIYGTAYIAMFIILIARMCVLWICIMLSPLVAISIVFPELLTDKMDIQQQFLDHAFVPVKMAIPLALGYILISQMQVSIDTSSGIATSGEIDLSQGGQFARGVSITTLMYGVSSIAVIWFAVFTASEKVVGHGMVESIKGYVETAGSTVAKLPTYLPIFPVSGTMASVSSLTGAMGELQNVMRQQGLDRDREVYNATIGKIFPSSDIVRAVQDIKRVVDGQRMDETVVRGSLSKLTSDPGRFREQVASLAGAFPQGSAGSEELARVLGINVNQLTDTGKIEEARVRLAAGGSAPAPAAPTADFSQIQRQHTQGLGTITLTNANTGIPTESDRTAMGFSQPNASNNNTSTLDLKTVDLANFISNLTDSRKVLGPAFQSIVMSSEFHQMTEKEEIRAQLARVPQLLTRIRQLVGTPGLSNDDIRNTYLDIVTPHGGDKTSSTAITAANAALGIPS